LHLRAETSKCNSGSYPLWNARAGANCGSNKAFGTNAIATYVAFTSCWRAFLISKTMTAMQQLATPQARITRLANGGFLVGEMNEDETCMHCGLVQSK